MPVQCSTSHYVIQPLSTRLIKPNFCSQYVRQSCTIVLIPSSYGWIDKDDKESSKPSVFQNIDARRSPHTVDRFASHYNTKLSVFNCIYIFFAARLWNSMSPRRRLGVFTCLLNCRSFEKQGSFLCERNADNPVVEVVGFMECLFVRRCSFEQFYYWLGFPCQAPGLIFKKEGAIPSFVHRLLDFELLALLIDCSCQTSSRSRPLLYGVTREVWFLCDSRGIPKRSS